MKYLKAFEENYYEEIDFNKYSELMFFKSDIRYEKFTTYEIEKIEGICGDIKVKIEGNGDDRIIEYINKKYSASKNFEISKLNDEYFLFAYHNHSLDWLGKNGGNPHKFFKCDQLYGLLQCFKKIFKK